MGTLRASDKNTRTPTGRVRGAALTRVVAGAQPYRHQWRLLKALQHHRACGSSSISATYIPAVPQCVLTLRTSKGALLHNLSELGLQRQAYCLVPSRPLELDNEPKVTLGRFTARL